MGAIWQATDQMASCGQIVRLLLLTGARRNEIGKAKWSKLKGDTLVIPPERYKTDEEHAICLTPAAMQIIGNLPRNSPYLVPSPTNPQKPINRWSSAKIKRDKLCGVENWVLHDTRRVVRNHLTTLDVSDAIAERVLGHEQKGILAVYNVHQLLELQREALLNWQAKLYLFAARPPSIRLGS
jgi:integrase